MAKRLVITMKNLVHIISFVCLCKQLLEPVRSLVTYLQGNFEFKKTEEKIIHIAIKKQLKRLMSYFSQYTPKLLVWLSLVLKRNGHNHEDSRRIGLLFLQKRSGSIGNDKYTYCSLILHLLKWNFVQLRKGETLYPTPVHLQVWLK